MRLFNCLPQPIPQVKYSRLVFAHALLGFNCFLPCVNLHVNYFSPAAFVSKWREPLLSTPRGLLFWAIHRGTFCTATYCGICQKWSNRLGLCFTKHFPRLLKSLAGSWNQNQVLLNKEHSLVKSSFYCTKGTSCSSCVWVNQWTCPCFDKATYISQLKTRCPGRNTFICILLEIWIPLLGPEDASTRIAAFICFLIFLRMQCLILRKHKFFCAAIT